MPQKSPSRQESLDASACLAFSVRKAARVVTQLYDEAFAPLGLKSTQFSLLNAINASGQISINDLAAALVMDRTTLTRNLKPLRSSGLVGIVPGDDKRVRVVSLTAAGKKLLRQALPLWRQIQQQAIERLGHRISDRLGRDLDSVIDLSR